jgi:hypothetical protein
MSVACGIFVTVPTSTGEGESMYSTPYGAAGSDPVSSFVNLVVAGSVVYLVVMLCLVLGTMLVSYLIIKAAVRNGVIEAIKKTGVGGGTPTYVQGYPPPQDGYGAPPAPVAEYQGYRGPNG